MIAGHIRPGDTFPSVRTLSKELKINPNTAHKVIAQLVAEGLIEVRPGIGTVVAELPKARESERIKLVEHEIEQLVVEAKKLGMELDDVLDAVSDHWERLGGTKSKAADQDKGGRRKE